MAKRKQEDMGEDLCRYCPIPEEYQGVRCYGGEPIMCEGRKCPEAYDAYMELDDDGEEEDDKCE